MAPLRVCAFLPLVCFAFLSLAAGAKIRIDPMTHDVALVTQQNWDGKVQKFRAHQVFAVLFYKDGCSECQSLLDGEFNTLAKKMKGMVGVLAVDCGESAKLCTDQNVSSYPTILIFPPLPLPPYKFETRTHRGTDAEPIELPDETSFSETACLLAGSGASKDLRGEDSRKPDVYFDNRGFL